jgi:RING finger family protein
MSEITMASQYVVLETRDAFNSSGGGSSGFNAGSTSPTTAVAMIILYSITGVITALFLVIIVTGAVRAHRHPERYGPRAGHGRPRQSRAKGLARAMLDTLPIVKWGEKEGEQPADVEMASGGAAPATGGVLERSTSKEDDQDADTVQEGEASNEKESQAAKAASPEPTEPVDENIGCSICTDDFERGQDVRVLPCNHQFHPACIDPWLLNVSGTCPLW